MKALITTGAAILAAAMVIAGCGGSGGAAATASGAAAAHKTVSTQNVAGTGTVLVDSAGMALYSPDQEKAGKIMCAGSCTSIWKPLTIASGKPSGPGNLGVVKRPDGMRQVTSGGRPLYTFVQDQPGQVTGNGASDSFGGQSFTWRVITSKGAPATAAQSTPKPSGGGRAYTY